MYFMFSRVEIPEDDSTPEPEIEDDDAELILEKVEEEMMADYDEEDEDVLHIDDISKLYGQQLVYKTYKSVIKNYTIQSLKKKNIRSPG